MFRNPVTGRLNEESLGAVREEVRTLRSRAEELERAVEPYLAGTELPITPALPTEADATPRVKLPSDPTLPQILTELRGLRQVVDRIAQQAMSQPARVQVIDELGDWPGVATGVPQGWQEIAVDLAGVPQGVAAWDPWDPQRAAQGPFISLVLVPNEDRLSVTSRTNVTDIPISSLYPSIPPPSPNPIHEHCCPEGVRMTTTRTWPTERTLYMRSSPDLLQLVGVVTYELRTDYWECRDVAANPQGQNRWALGGLQGSSTEIIRRRMTALPL
jgi:hypothetical protein